MRSRKLLVLRPPGKVFRSQRLKNKFNFRRMVRASRRSGTVLRGGRRSVVEFIPEDARLSGGRLHFDPLPGGEGDELISGEILCRALGLIVSLRRVELQKCVGLVAEQGVRARHKIRRGRGGFREDGMEVSLIGIPTGQQGDVALLPARENRTNIFGQEIAIDDRPRTGSSPASWQPREARPPALARSASRECAPERVRKFLVRFFRRGERLRCQSRAEESAALADRSLEQALRQAATPSAR